MINQGDIYWVKVGDIPHPHVVVQDDLFNHSRVDTIIVCALTSNLQRVSRPGNVLLDVGEGDLPKQSVVEVSLPCNPTKIMASTITPFPELSSYSHPHAHSIQQGYRLCYRVETPVPRLQMLRLLARHHD